MISVIIPTYKNKGLLIKNLKNNLTFLKDCEIIVVNDDPSESIKNDLQQFPVVLLENKENLGFGGAVNRGVERAQNPYIMLLNSDVILQDKKYQRGIDHFKKNSALFAVSFAQLEKDGVVVGKNRIFWKHGFFYHQMATDLMPGPNAWAEGGASLIDKNKFLELSGFDPIYKPFYWEDIDLSYRALKSGYSILFDPDIKVIHYHESTIGKYFSKKIVKTIAFRNQFIFIWKNITDPTLVLSHLIFFIPNMVYYVVKNDLNYFLGFIEAIKMHKPINQKRTGQINKSLLTDSKILSLER